MQIAKTDTRVSCPIVCGEYMRATGFFFEAGGQNYLITARHNVLPTDATKLATGKFQFDYQEEEVRSEIDIYLREDSTFKVKSLNLSNKEGIIADEHIDCVGIPINFAPEEYGYTSWKGEDVAKPEDTSSTLDIIGFPGPSFPSTNVYDIDRYTEEIGQPYVLSIKNGYENSNVSQSKLGLTGIGFDLNQNNNYDYDGLSGSPVLGDGLVGIHMMEFGTYVKNPDTGGKSCVDATAYVNAGVLKEIFDGS